MRYKYFIISLFFISCMIPQQKSAESGFQVISEEIFMKFSIGKSYIPKYMNEWYALVILGNDNKYYINFEGKCAVAVTEDDVYNFLKEITLPSKVDTNLPPCSKHSNLAFRLNQYEGIRISCYNGYNFYKCW
jgi:hypothetical protein